MEFLHWAVIAKTTSKNNGIEETVEHIEALFTYPDLAQDFIDKCLPEANRDKFHIKYI